MDNEPVFVIPTYRLRDVGRTVEAYDDNFHRNGHGTRIFVFDDSPETTSRKYYGSLEGISTYNEVYYVGPIEKAEFLDHVIRRTGVAMADSIIYRMFRPSYGGNRNFTLAYTLGRKFISSDDDMLPGGYVAGNPGNHSPALAEDEVMKGEWVSSPSQSDWREFDVYAAFLDILGKSPATLGFRTGEQVADARYDTKTNSIASWGDARPPQKSSLIITPLESPLEGSRIRLAQSFRTGTGDIDAVELLGLFLYSDAKSLEKLQAYFVMSDFTPVVTRRNWRFDCGVSGYDNESGLPPFFPTTLRFEDYSLRLWSSSYDGVAAAHVNAVQHHTRSLYMRPTLAEEIYNEAIAMFLKRKISETLTKVGDFGFDYGYDGVVQAEDISGILEEAKKLDSAVELAGRKAKGIRQDELNKFRRRLNDLFAAYDEDAFMRNFSRRIDEENYAIRDCMTYWPTILEISNWRARSRGLPMRKVANKRKS